MLSLGWKYQMLAVCFRPVFWLPDYLSILVFGRDCTIEGGMERSYGAPGIVNFTLLGLIHQPKILEATLFRKQMLLFLEIDRTDEL